MFEPTPAAAAALATPPPATPAATPAAAPAAPAATPAAAPAAAPAPDPSDATLNILAAATAPAAPAATPAPPAAAAPTPGELADRTSAIAAAIKPSDLGQGLDPAGIPVGWDSAAVSVVAGIAAKHGLKPEAVADIVAGYADHARQQAAAAAAADARINTDMVAQLRATFGPDLPRRAQEADRGGLSVFGPELWPELRNINTFVNDSRVLAALAARGRATATDPLPGGPGKSTEEKDLASRMYPNLPT